MSKWLIKTLIVIGSLGIFLGTVSLAKAQTVTLPPSYNLGDIIYASATKVLSKLNIGSVGECLKVSSGLLPDWDTCGGISDGDKGDITVSSSGSAWTIDNQAVTFAKFQNITANRLLGREATTGSMQEIQLSGRFDLNGGVLDVLGGTPDGATGTYQFNIDGTNFSGSDVLSTPDDGGTIEIQDKYSYIKDDASPTKRFRFEASGLTAGVDRIITTQDRSGTMAMLEDTLGNFASTTSAQLALVLTDEQGSGGGFVRATSPTLTTPNIGSATGTGLLLSGLTASRAVVTDASKNLSSSATTSTELGYVSGVTSAIQTQINTKAPTASPTFTGTVSVPATNLTVGSSLPFSDSAGTLTLQNIDVVDSTTESTFESAIDTLANLTSIQGKTITLGGDFITSGASSLTLTTTGATNVTLPTSGTLVNDAVTALNSLGTVNTSLTGTLQATAGVLSVHSSRVIQGSAVTTTSTSYVDVTGMSYALSANSTYTFQLVGEWSSNNASGQASIGLSMPAGTTWTWTRFTGTTSSALNSVMQNTTDQINQVSIGSANAIRTVYGTGRLTTGGNSGNLQVRLVSGSGSHTATVQNMILDVQLVN